MKKMTAIQAAQFCKDGNIEVAQWNCGYALEVSLELNHGIVLEHENAWVELENILYYNEAV